MVELVVARSLWNTENTDNHESLKLKHTCFFPRQVSSAFLSQCWSWSHWVPVRRNQNEREFCRPTNFFAFPFKISHLKGTKAVSELEVEICKLFEVRALENVVGSRHCWRASVCDAILGNILRESSEETVRGQTRHLNKSCLMQIWNGGGEAKPHLEKSLKPWDALRVSFVADTSSSVRAAPESECGRHHPVVTDLTF